MDITTKHFQAGLLVLLQQWRACEADKHSAWHQGLHHTVQLTALGAVALIHKHKQIAHGLAGLRCKVFDKLLKIIHTTPAKLVHQGAHQAWR